MMHHELLKHGLYDCHGWAYDKCDQLSVYLMIEHWPGGSWAATGLCRLHAARVFGGDDSETHLPLSRTWWKIFDFAREGSWPAEPVNR